MKSSNATFGDKPSKQQQRQPSASASQTRVSASGNARIERGRWASCEDRTVSEPQAAPTHRIKPTGALAFGAAPRPEAPASAGEPRTGVVRRVDFSQGAALSRGVPPRVAASARRERQVSPHGAPRASESPAASSGDWSCLEWGRPAKERRGKRNSKVTIVQLSRGGDLLRQNGPDAWLPEAGNFMHRMAGLVAQGLGFAQCRSLCLKSAGAVLTVAAAGTNIVAVSGPIGSMANVLRRAGLE